MMHFLAVNRIRPDVERDAVARAIPGHRRWIAEGLAAGHVLQAGKWGATGGIVLFQAADEEQARAMLQEDPLVSSGSVDVELAQFWPDVLAR